MESPWKSRVEGIPGTLVRVDEAGQSVVQEADPYEFTFHRVFHPDTTNRQVYDTLVSSIVDSTMNGVNGTVFAYGQTSSGKVTQFSF